jgi:hypothetical protein
MKTGDRAELFAAFRRAWSRSTSADPDGWTEGNAAWGQCAVTALLVQDALGGRLVRATIDGVPHYYNLLDSSEEVDLTREQFPPASVATDESLRDRDYVLSFPDTNRRYRLLKAAVAALEHDRHRTEKARGVVPSREVRV